MQSGMDEKLKRPSRAEEKKINRDIKNDPDIFEASGDDFAKSKAASKGLAARFIPRGHQTPKWQARINREGLS